MTKTATREFQHSTKLSNRFDSFPDDFEKIAQAYAEKKHAVEVDFRELVPFGSGVDRATHLFHSYPAKLLPNIPIFFLNCGLIENGNSIVYDPFCGTGTVLVEAIISGHRAAGADANPLARKIARAKTTHLSEQVLQRGIERVLVAAETEKPANFAPVVDVRKWFTDDARKQLGKLRAAIIDVDSPAVREFLEVAFSQCVRKASLADPRMAVPVRRKDGCNGANDITKLFADVAQSNSVRLQRLPKNSAPVCIGHDARDILSNEMKSESYADIIITSPPYAGAQKYIRASSLSLGWLGLVPEDRLRNLESQNIGREHLTESERKTDWAGFQEDLKSQLDKISAKNPLRASIFALYMEEMRAAIGACVASLRAGGIFVLIIGDNQVCGLPVKTSNYVKRMLEDEGLQVIMEMVDSIRSRGLMTKRNKTAGLISHEHVIVLKKTNG